MMKRVGDYIKSKLDKSKIEISGAVLGAFVGVLVVIISTRQGKK